MIRLAPILVLALGLSTPATAEPLAKQLFGAKASASAQAPASLGSYAKGCLAGGVQLAQKGSSWLQMRVARNRSWGHPDLIKYIERLSK